VPGNCLLIEGHSFKVKESTGEVLHKKSYSQTDMEADPFLNKYSIVVEGQGKALVCEVGD